MDEKVSVREYLEDYMKLVEAKEDDLKGMTGILQFNFTEDGNGYWYVEMVDGKVMPIAEGVAENPTMIITGAYDTFYKVRTGALTPEEVFPTGKLKLSGDTSFTMRFREAGLT